MINGITIGADPELFIVDNNNKVISAVGLIPGEKGKPYVADNMPKGFGMEIDNILGEFNIPPVKLRSGFVNNINYMKDYIDNFVKQINPNYGIQCIASRMVDDDQLQSDEAKLFGCMPDYNVYTEKKNKKPNAKNQNLRSAGFHIHIGYDHPAVPESLRMVKLLDIFLGIPSVIIDPDKERRKLYGRAGAFRLTKYGFEYRTLSSYMMSKDSILNLVWDLLTLALNFGGLPNAFDKNQIQYLINESDVEEAKKFLNNFEYIKESHLERVQNFLKTFEV